MDLAGSKPDLATPVGDMGMPMDMAMPPPSAIGVCPFAHFCWQNPLLQPNQLSAMWGASPSDLWAVGWSGVALHWDGIAWTQVPTGTTMFFTAVWGRSSSEMWVLAGDGSILFWDGTHFTTQRSPTGMGLDAIWGNASTVWAVGGGVILQWDGTAWVSVPSGYAGGLTGIWGSASNDVGRSAATPPATTVARRGPARVRSPTWSQP